MHSTIILNWDPSPEPVDEYRLYRGSIPGNESEIPYAVTATSEFEDTAVIAGRQYSYKVTVVSNGVESEDSATILSQPVHFSPVAPAIPPQFSPTGEPPVFGALAGFAILAGSTITVVPGEEVIAAGDVGVWPGTSITGFESPSAISGVFHPGTVVARAAQTQLTAAYNYAVAAVNADSTPATTLPGDVGGMRLVPGVYNVASSLGLTGAVTLDAQMDPNAAWIIQIGSTLTTAAASNVVLVNGARAESVFWQVGSSATFGANTNFAGTIMAQASITVGNAVNVDGRLLARAGAVTFDGDARVVLFLIGPDCLTPLPPSPPAVPPAPPNPPTGLEITNED